MTSEISTALDNSKIGEGTQITLSCHFVVYLTHDEPGYPRWSLNGVNIDTYFRSRFLVDNQTLSEYTLDSSVFAYEYNISYVIPEFKESDLGKNSVQINIPLFSGDSIAVTNH